MPVDYDIKDRLGRRVHTDLTVKVPLWAARTFPGLSRRIGRLRTTAQYFDELRRFERAQRPDADRLTDRRVEVLRKHDFDDELIAEWHDRFENDPQSNIQYYVVPLVERVIDQDPTVRSVMNIGVKIAYFDADLAERYPDRHFFGVDFMHRLAEFNRRYARANLTLVSGYARDLLATGEVSADLVYFSSTATVIPNRELRKNLALIAERSRYVIVNEPIFTLPGSTALVDPNAIPLDRSFLVFTPDVPPGYDPPSDEDRSLCFVHNYVAMVEEAGFVVDHFEINMKDGVLPLVQLIARKA